MFQLDRLDDVRKLFLDQMNHSSALLITFVSLSALVALSLLTNILSILLALRVRRYKRGFADAFSEAVFRYDVLDAEQKDPAVFWRHCAMHYATAVDRNRHINTRVGKWLLISSYSLLMTGAVGLGMLISIVAMLLRD